MWEDAFGEAKPQSFNFFDLEDLFILNGLDLKQLTFFQKPLTAINQVLERHNIVLLAGLNSLDKWVKGLVDWGRRGKTHKAPAFNRGEAIHMPAFQEIVERSSFSSIQPFFSLADRDCKLSLVLGVHHPRKVPYICFVSQFLVYVMQDMERVIKMNSSKFAAGLQFSDCCMYRSLFVRDDDFWLFLSPYSSEEHPEELHIGLLIGVES
jgi:hypothetical protein